MIRIIIAFFLALGSLFTYCTSTQPNPVTGENQRIQMTVEQEVALGGQAAQEVVREFGGLDPDASAQARLDEIGEGIVAQSDAAQMPYDFDFHLLATEEVVNAMALPGGHIFVTRALWQALETEEQLAAVLGHEISHVVARHGAEHLAKAQLTESLTGAAVLATYDPDNPGSIQAGQLAQLVGQLTSMRFSRDDELEADSLGLRFVDEAGYEPQALIQALEILARAGPGNRMPEFFSTHPSSEKRIQRLREQIAAQR